MSENTKPPHGLRKKRKGTYSISVVAEMFGVHQQTIRLYEREGLIAPNRSLGNTRQFTEEDVDRLEEVIYLTHKLGINLAGVTMIFKLKKKIKKMQDEMNKIFDQTKESLDLDVVEQKKEAQEQFSRLMQLRNQSADAKQRQSSLYDYEIDDEQESASDEEIVDLEDDADAWEDED